MHSSRMRTARSLPYGVGLCPGGSLFRGVSVRGMSLSEGSLRLRAVIIAVRYQIGNYNCCYFKAFDIIEFTIIIM